MNILLILILNCFLANGINEGSKKTKSYKQETSSRIVNARATSVYVSNNNVYIVGYQHSEDKKTVAKLWKNGTEYDLTDGTNDAFALSVFVSGNDVYVVGYENSDSHFFRPTAGLIVKSFVAKLWKNGIAQNLSNKDVKYSMARSVFVSGDDVYVAGMEVEPNEKDSLFTVARLWKNGVVQNLSDNCMGIARSVFVSGNDVYVAGSGKYECSPNAKSYVARLWKNGIAQNLSDGAKMTWAHSVYVFNDDTYVAGIEYPESDLNKETPVLWKNGIVQYMNIANITSNTGCDNVTGSANSICVSESGDVYVVGFINCGNIYSVLWKNGIAQLINQDGTFQMIEELARNNSVFVSGEDVYITGSEHGVKIAAIWKNNILQELTEYHPDEIMIIRQQLSE